MKFGFLKRIFRAGWRLPGFSALAALYLELFIRGDLGKLGTWLSTHPHMVLMNVVTIACITALIHGLVNRKAVTVPLVMGLVYLFGLINSLKFKTLGQYYYPWDNSLAGELGGVSQNVVNLDFTLPLLFLALGIGLCLLVLKGRGGDWAQRSILKRLAVLGLAAACLGAMVFHKEWKVTKTLELLGVRNYAWAPVHSYQNNGATVAYLVNWRMNYVEKPKTYSKEQIAQLVEGVTAAYEADRAARGAGDGVRPNIIVVMSEALWDPNQLTDLSFSEDPMKHLNAAKKAAFVSPTFGAIPAMWSSSF